jgi:hypothetical protein
MARIRKAFRVSINGTDSSEIVHAPTASKARASVISDLTECGWSFRDAIVSTKVRRSPANDVTLPDQHRLVAELDEQDRRIIAHAFGSRVRMGKEGYRDHYCTDPADRRLLRLSWEFGLFSGPHGEGAYGDTGMFCGAFFHLTELGKVVARSMLPTYR